MHRLLAIVLALALAAPAFATDRYLRSTDGSDSDDGLSWANAHATLADAFLACAAGDRVFVSDNHAETQGSALTLTSPGTAASPVQVICVDDAAGPPTARATTATISTTGSFNITYAGMAYVYGVTFSVGDTTNLANFTTATTGNWVFETCSIVLNNSHVSSRIRFGTTSHNARLINTSLVFGSVSQGINANGQFYWDGGTLSGTIPTTLFSQSDATSHVIVRGVDLSAAASGKTLVGTAVPGGIMSFQNCKLGASVTPCAALTGNIQTIVELINCDSGDTNYRYQKSTLAGVVTQETVIVRTGGASDGTTPISYKFVTTANSKHYAPLYGPWVTFWNETTGSAVTVTAEVVTDNVTLTDAEAWIEVEHLATNASSQSTTERDQLADPIFGTPANQTTSSETWTTTGLTTPIKQKLSEAVTPAEKGPIRARVVLAKPSTTMYVCPKFQ